MTLKTFVAFFLLCSVVLAQRPIGTFTLGSFTSNICPVGATCQNFTVTIPSVPTPAAGVLAIMNPSGSTATDVFFSVTNGSTWWGGNPPSSQITSFFNSLISSGHRIILVRWTLAWYSTPQGVPLGQLAAACRPATVIEWLRQNYSAPSFNVIGTSAGGAQVAYALADYSVFANKVVVDSGPPFMELKLGCENVSGYAYDDSAKSIVDGAFGFWSNGPCVTGNVQYEDTWNINSVESGTTFLYPATSVHIIIGTNDSAYIQNRGTDYYNLLLLNGQNVQYHLIQGMYHGVGTSTVALNELLGILTSGNPTPTPTVPPSPSPTPTCTCP